MITAAEKEEAELQARWKAEHARGTADAENDARTGHLAVLIYQSVVDGEEEYRHMFRDRYQTELRRVADSPQNMSDTALRYVWGYNEAAIRELARRSGDGAKSAVWSVTGSVPFRNFLQRVEAPPSPVPD